MFPGEPQRLLRQAGRQTWMYIWVLPFSAVLGWALLKADTEIGFEKRRFQEVPVGEWERETGKHKDSTKYALYNRLELCANETHLIFMGKPRDSEDHALLFSTRRAKKLDWCFQHPSVIVWVIFLRPLTPWHFWFNQWTDEKKLKGGELHWDPISIYWNRVM